MARFGTNTNSFTIAHYILLFLVTALCIGIIAWILITRNNSSPSTNASPNVVHISQTTPCVQRTVNTVAQMWAYDPDSVPQKYWDIATDYMNAQITTRTYGICGDVSFICRAGDIRRDCDPCAVPSARDYAMNQHIADLIRQNCPNSINADEPVRPTIE